MSDAKQSNNMWSVIAVLIIGTFMTILNASLINIALPKMMAVFGVSLDSIQWVVTAYSIALGAVIPLSGYLADVFGSKKLFIAALAVFTIGSLLCGIAWSNSSMIAFRIIQGIGGGVIGPVGNAMIFRTVPPEKLGLAMGIYGIAALAAPAIGPTIGGYIIAGFSWRMLFFLSVPFGIVGVVMGILMLPEIPSKAPGNFDTFGFISSTVGLVCLFYVLGKWTSIDWREMEYPLILSLGIASLILFTINELMHPTPLLDLRVLKIYDFTAWTLLMSTLSMAMMGIMFIMPIFLQSLMGYDSIKTGLLLFPSAIATAIMMPFSGKIFDKYGYKAAMIPGLILFTAVSYPLMFLSLDTSANTINLLLVIRGLALGLVMMPPTALAMKCVPEDLINQASSLSNIIRQIATTVCVVLITTILQHSIAVNTADINDQLSISNPFAGDAVKMIQGAYWINGASLSDARVAALNTLGGLAQRQAYIDAINHIQSLMFLIAIFCLVFLLCIDLPKRFRAHLEDKSKGMEALADE